MLHHYIYIYLNVYVGVCVSLCANIRHKEMEDIKGNKTYIKTKYLFLRKILQDHELHEINSPNRFKRHQWGL